MDPKPKDRGRARPSDRGPRAWALAMVVLVAAPACGGGDRRDAVLAPSEFVSVVTALREAERELPSDSPEVRFVARRGEILDRHEVTEEDLRRFLTVHAQDVDLLQEVWDSINERLKYLPEEESDTSTADAGRRRIEPPPLRQGPRRPGRAGDTTSRETPVVPGEGDPGG